MRSFLIAAALWLEFVSLSYSQQQVINIWQTGQQAAKSQLNIEQRKGSNITEVNRPCLDVFLPTKPNVNHPAVLIFPGGGYRQIVLEKEGYKIAKWLNDNGIAAFVLTYRLNIDSALLDAQRALSLVRSRAKEFNIDPDRIGVMGFSAGAHLSLNVATHLNRSIRTDLIDSVSCKPNFMVLAYGAFTGLLKLVDKEAPPAFLVHASNDEKAPVSQSIYLFSALHDVDVPVEMHIYEKGGHGFALLEDRGPVIGWAQQCIDWMRMRGIVSVR
jgi:acetyl esterase/lipase